MSDHGVLTTRASDLDRAALVRRGQWLSYATVGYNTLEGLASIVAGGFAGSISLVGFGIDSLIEVASGGTAMWRLRADVDEIRRERVERASLRIIGVLFLLLAAYVAIDAVKTLWRHEAPGQSIAGIVIAALSLVVMPLLARAKRRVASGLSSRALHADATQTDLCTYLSAILLGGLVLNALIGWWWADPLAALVMTPIIAREGIAGLRAEKHCEDCVS
ncbi:MAG TPA: cation transporter [Gemmatimonadaceae bacterium]|nr:cation transporter [Gemmatimonadaceae bacterium]